MAPAHRAGSEITPKATADLRGPADPKSILKSLVIVVTGSSQESPESQSHVVQGAFEIFQSLDRLAPQCQPNLDGPERRVERSDFICKTRLRHDRSRGLSACGWVTIRCACYSRYASTDMLRSRRRSVSPLTRELQEIS